MKILVTGAFGYIGSVLVPLLLDHGHQIIAVDNFMYNQSTLLQHCMSDNFTVIRGDVTNTEFMDYVLNEYTFDLIIPLACLTGAPLCAANPRYAQSVILDSIEYMLESVGSSVKIIYPTTNSGYGIGTANECTEESPLNPISVYGNLKCTAEEIILKRGNAVSLRLATAFGVSPRMRLDLLVNDLTYRAVTDRVIAVFEGHYRRNFIHVRDIVSAILHTINNWDLMKNQVYNVGLSSANIDKLHLATLIAKKTGAEVVEITGKPDPDKRDYVVSNAKLEATGWKPVFTLEDGIAELVKAYQIIRKNQHSNV